MHIIRRALEADFQRIYELQNVPFRDKVFLEPLHSLDSFLKETKDRCDNGLEQFFVLDSDGTVSGFIRFVKTQNGWEALTWGRWMNTLAYASAVLAFEKLGFPKLVFSVRLENERVLRLYSKFNGRRTGMELINYREFEFGPIKTANLQYFELTPEEYRERAESMRKDSLQLVFE
jgi:hypothetical protein